MTGTRDKNGQRISPPPARVAVTPTFYALQPRWFGPDRFYKVFVTPQRLAFAYVAGQVYDQKSADMQLQAFTLFLFPLVRRWLRQREERERQYTPEVVFGPDFLGRDARNLYIEKMDVSVVRINWRRSLWSGVNAGTMTIRQGNLTDRRFVLAGDQIPEAILAALRTFWPDVETKGTPRLPKV